LNYKNVTEKKFSGNVLKPKLIEGLNLVKTASTDEKAKEEKKSQSPKSPDPP